jgi:hypothetical protein
MVVEGMQGLARNGQVQAAVLLNAAEQFTGLSNGCDLEKQVMVPVAFV